MHGIKFVGENGWIWVTRGTLTASDRELLKTKLPDDKRLYFSNDHMGNFLDCVKSRKAPICEAEIGPSLGDAVPSRRYFGAAGRKDQLGSGEGGVGRR